MSSGQGLNYELTMITQDVIRCEDLAQAALQTNDSSAGSAGNQSIAFKRAERNRKAKAWRSRNKEKYNAYQRKYYSQTKGAANKSWALRNKEKIKNYNKKFYEINKEKILTYEADRYKTSLTVRLSKLGKELTRRAVLKIQSGKLLKQSKREIYFLGCDLNTFKNHIESAFKCGMCWDNYGNSGWVVDHIIPISRFNLESDDGLLSAFNYKNTQPLWYKENQIKGNRIKQ